MPVIPIIALTIGLGVLTAGAVFTYFGAYWRTVWRQNRLEESTTSSESTDRHCKEAP